MTAATEAAIVDTVKAYLAEDCGLAPEDVDADTPLFSSRRLDSIDILKLVAFIEREFRFKVSALDVTVERFDTLGRIARFVGSRIASAT